MMNFEYLCEQYALGSFIKSEPLNPGTASQVWRLEADCGTFLVRTLKDKEQGEREWSIHQHLISRQFDAMPALVLTAEEQPFLEVNGEWYQMQEYMTGTMPDPSQSGMAVAMAKLAKELSGALSVYPGGALIHGDLGPWNMMRCADERLMVIDFGEAKSGDPYFDYASLLGGVINHTAAELREQVCGDFVRELDCDRARLLEQLRCWAEQGIQLWTGKNEKMVARFNHALNWAEENLYAL